jgi:Tfp pilus assembly protein PilN
MSVSDFRKWLAVGTGVGIEIGREDLNVTVARVRPGGVRILGTLTIKGFRSQPAAEWGATYASFLKKLRSGYVAATVMLPREDVIVRQVSLPGVADRDIPAALDYQIDALHPFAEEEAVHDWARIAKSPAILVGITRRTVLDKYITLFNEAGVKISAFTFSAAAMYSAVRMYRPPQADGFLAFSAQQGGGNEDEAYEVYGESPAKPLFSASLEMPESRALNLALSELRLPPEAEPVALESILPTPRAVPEGENLARIALPYATALVGACPRLALRLNLLPEKLRAARSRWLYVPTIALACLLLLAAIALVLRASYQDRKYIEVLNKEIRLLEPKVKRAAALEREIAVLRNRSQTLDNFRLRSKDDMDALNELTRALAPPTWLNGLQLSRTQLTINGETDQSTPLLRVLDGTKQFKRSEFTVPMTRTASGESFSIRASREGAMP